MGDLRQKNKFGLFPRKDKELSRQKGEPLKEGDGEEHAREATNERHQRSRNSSQPMRLPQCNDFPYTIIIAA